MKRYFLILFLSGSFIFGCGRDVGINSIKTGYGSTGFLFKAKNPVLSFVKNALPDKTYLTIVDLLNKKTKEYYFNSYGFLGPHEIIPELNKAVAMAFYFKTGELSNRILIIDFDGNKIEKEFIMPQNCQVIMIKKPDWSDKIFIIFRIEGEGKILFKTIDLQNYSVSNAELISDFSPGEIMFLERTPFLLIESMIENKIYLCVYDFSTKSMMQRYQIDATLVDIKESQNDSCIYGLMRISGENKGKILEFNLKDGTMKPLIELNGIVESLLVIENILYVVCQDINRPNQKNKEWLHARNLFVIEPNKSIPVDTIDWIHRLGKLIAFNKNTNEIIYTVIDYDDPRLWFIRNDKAVFGKIQRIIK